MSLARGSVRGSFFSWESKSQNTAQETRTWTGNVVLGAEGARYRDLFQAHPPAAGSGRSTRPARLHGSASRPPGLGASTQRLGRGAPPPVARAQRAARAQDTSLPAGDARGPRPLRLLAGLLRPRAGCGRERRRGRAARRPSHAAILTRAASPRARPRTSAIKRQFPRLPAKEQCAGKGGSPEEPTPEAAQEAGRAQLAALPGVPAVPRRSAPPPPAPDSHSSPWGPPRAVLAAAGTSRSHLPAPRPPPSALRTQRLPLPIFLPIFLLCFLHGLFSHD